LEGNIVEKQDRKQIMLAEVEPDTAMASAATISKVESQAVDRLIPASTMTFVSQELEMKCPPSTTLIDSAPYFVNEQNSHNS
jgi:hypothetical protein